VTPMTGLRLWLATAVYVGLVTVVTWSMFAARRHALTTGSTPASLESWNAWREDVRAQQDHPSPVKRAVPKSEEPPALVLMRDYFGVALTGAVLFSSLLYWIIVLFTAGILRSTADSSQGDVAAT
jgi:hypothetical protein